ncbi:MAG: peptidoglycan DD-metalloendopeptidase family protein [Actinomycetia bacterium]|nr:peptidoglycan DD-metalloendopeptidase family protein [Actinomycetes bacterium]
MEEKQSKSFTILVLSDAKSKVRKLRISFNFLRGLYVCGVILLAAAVILVSNLYITRQKLDEKIAEIERIEYKINYKTVELDNLEQKTSEIETKTKILENYLKEVEELDRVVRDITGQGGFESEVAVYNTELNADVDLENNPDEVFYYVMDQEQELDDIDALLDQLLQVAPGLSEKLSADKENIEDYIYLMEHTPSIWPTWGRLTSLFGERRWGYNHKGLDIANSTGVPVNATASGVVIYAGYHGGYGKKVMVYHGFDYTTVYAHLSTIDVDVGDEVKQGDTIGLMGNTGNSTGPHLHYEVLVDGIPKNPQDFMP